MRHLIDEVHAHVAESRLDFDARLKVWEQEHRKWFADRRREVEAQTLKAMYKFVLPLFALMYAPGAVAGYWLISNSKELRDKSDRTIALNDSIRREFSGTRDSLHFELEKARTLALAQQALLDQYQHGYLATLRETSTLQGSVAGQIAESERTRQQAVGAFRALDSARIQLAAAGDTVSGRLVQQDTTLRRVDGELTKLRSTMGVLSDRTRIGQTLWISPEHRTDIVGTNLSVWYVMARNRIQSFTLFRGGERVLMRADLVLGESLTFQNGMVRYRFTLREIHRARGTVSAEFELETLPPE